MIHIHPLARRHATYTGKRRGREIRVIIAPLYLHSRRSECGQLLPIQSRITVTLYTLNLAPPPTYLGPTLGLPSLTPTRFADLTLPIYRKPQNAPTRSQKQKNE